MFNKILTKISKYKLIVVLIIIILIIVIVKLNTRQKIVDTTINQTEKSTVSKNIENETVLITPTEEPKKNDDLSKIDTNEYESNGYIPINSLFPYEEATFLAEKYENNKVYVKTKIENKEKAERNLKYWYYLEVGSTLMSNNIIWE